jgi:hypothetical protein
VKVASETWRRWAAAVGLLFAACGPPFGFTPGHVFIIRGTSVFGSQTSPAVISAYASSHRALLGFDFLGICVLALSLICFAALLCRLSGPGSAGSILSLIGFGVSVLTATMVLVAVAAGVVIVELASPTDYPSISAAWLLIHGVGTIAPLPFSIFMMATGTVILTERSLPAWVGWLTLLVAGTVLGDGLNLFIQMTPLAAGWPFQPGGLPATSAIWAFVLSLALVLERRRLPASQRKPAC